MAHPRPSLLALLPVALFGVLILAACTDEEATEQASSGTPTTAEVTPTPYRPRLTGAEAAAIVQTTEDTRWDNPSPNVLGQTFNFDFDLGTDKCEALDFNATTRSWIVQCSDFVLYPDGRREEQGERTFRVDDKTSEYSQIIGR